MPSHGIPGDRRGRWGFWSLGDMGNTHIRDWKLSWAQVYNSGSWMMSTNLKDGVWQLDFPPHFVYQQFAIVWFQDKISSIKNRLGPWNWKSNQPFSCKQLTATLTVPIRLSPALASSAAAAEIANSIPSDVTMSASSLHRSPLVMIVVGDFGRENIGFMLECKGHHDRPDAVGNMLGTYE